MQHLIVQSDFEVDNPDIILRSSASKSGQETDFRARVQDFTNASSVFGDAFAAAIGHETGQNGLPVVRMQESQATLKGFLAFVHNEPGQMPDLDNMPPSELLDLWDASHKYNVAMLQMVVALQLRNRCLSGNANGHLALKLLARSGGNGSFANAQAALNHLVSLDPTTLPHALLEMCDSSSLATLFQKAARESKEAIARANHGEKRADDALKTKRQMIKCVQGAIADAIGSAQAFKSQNADGHRAQLQRALTLAKSASA